MKTTQPFMDEMNFNRACETGIVCAMTHEILLHCGAFSCSEEGARGTLFPYSNLTANNT
jgi:hypothetical protein